MSELGATLRTWRDRLSPAAAGLPAGRARRAAGLRREELADLAGLSVDYVVRLEQGRSVTPSAQVVAALARALQLTAAERDHLYRLARLTPPADGQICDHLPPGVLRMLNRLGDAAVAAFAADWQLIWWNRGWAALLGDPFATPPAARNFARTTFLGVRMTTSTVRSADQSAVEVAVASDLRRASGRFPRDRRLAGLIEELVAGSPRFADLWTSGVVGAHREDSKVVEHPSVGPIDVDCDVLSDGEAERKIVILTAADETRMRLALMVRADQDLAIPSMDAYPGGPSGSSP